MAIADYIFSEGLPLSTTSKESFKLMVDTIRAAPLNYKLPSRAAVSSDILDIIDHMIKSNPKSTSWRMMWWLFKRMGGETHNGDPYWMCCSEQFQKHSITLARKLWESQKLLITLRTSSARVLKNSTQVRFTRWLLTMLQLSVKQETKFQKLTLTYSNGGMYIPFSWPSPWRHREFIILQRSPCRRQRSR